MSDDLQIYSLSTVYRLDLFSIIFRFEERFPSMNPTRWEVSVVASLSAEPLLSTTCIGRSFLG